jgi:3-oxoacyl-[acyl-carrier protein] reductase
MTRGNIIDGTIAFVTGGSGVIGSACVADLGRKGARVAVGYREDVQAAVRVASQVPDAIAVQIDVTKPECVNKAFAQIESELGSVAVLVTAAGDIRDRPMLRMRDDDWEHVMRVNLNGAFYCMRRALPGMVADRWGRIVGIGSLSGLLGNAGQCNYAAAKAGLVGLARALAREVGRHGVTVNVVAPGLVESGLSASTPDAARQRLDTLASIGSRVEPGDIATAVSFCVDCPAMTGQVIAVDGGIT